MQAWPQPAILDWNSWVAGLWEQYGRRVADAPMLLSALQEEQLWNQMLSQDRDRVVAPGRMAELAQEAYGLLGSYCAHGLRREAAASASGGAHEDAERFLAWAEAFDRACRQHGWIARSRLEELLASSPALLDPVPEVCLVGFDRTTPAQAALLQSLEAAGTKISRYAAPPAAGKPKLYHAKDQRAELEACAWWCRERLSSDPTCRIGVIAPDLGRVRAELDRVFRRILMPQTTYWPSPDLYRPSANPQPDPALPYEFSLGTSLATLPVVRAALLLLRWFTEPLGSAELTWLLTAGWLAASKADELALARLDRELRQKSVSPEVPLAWLTSAQLRALPADLRQRLLRVQAHLASARSLGGHSGVTGRGDDPTERRRTYAHWAELVPSLLTEAGWPGYREADSFTFQTIQRWTRLLGELAQLGFDGSQPIWSEFLHTLEAQAQAVIFAAESITPPIQVLGAFESSGQSFDALWFLGADDTHWPATGRPHPLLPAWLQREARMPHATPETDWLLAQGATARIVTSAPEVVLSHALQERGVALRASPLLLMHAATAEPASAQAAPKLTCVSLEAVADTSGTLPWPVDQSAGGAEVLKRQAACAFQTFATVRLGARPLEEPTQGLDQAERGIKLHAVLEQLWSPKEGVEHRLHTRDDLHRAIADGSLATLLTQHVQAVFAPALTANGDAWNDAYLACEQQRVHARLLTWLLHHEARRQPFKVEALEKEVDGIHVGGLQLKVRLDRVDLLADQTRLLIDYKTSENTTESWMGDRPKEPQLPLYAVFGGVENVSGVAFAQIRAGKTRLLARAADPPGMVSEELGSLSEKNRFDDEIRSSWQQALLALAGQFTRGEASVNPREGSETCKYCPLSGLCRVHATSRLLGETIDDAGEESLHV